MGTPTAPADALTALREALDEAEIEALGWRRSPAIGWVKDVGPLGLMVSPRYQSGGKCGFTRFPASTTEGLTPNSGTPSSAPKKSSCTLEAPSLSLRTMLTCRDKYPSPEPPPLVVE